MKVALLLTKRNLKEMIRDPISLIFCLGLPSVMLVFMQLVFGNIDASNAVMFKINNFAPAIATFGFTFTMLYVALTLSGDRGSSFMYRLLVSPVKSWQYLTGFLFAFLLVAFVQTVIFYLVSLIFGLTIGVGLLVSLVYLIPSALFYCACAMLIGTICQNEKQAGPVCSIVITASGLLGGIWMPLEVMGGGLLKVCEYLPFYNGVKMAQNAVVGNYDAWLSALIVVGYALITALVALIIFRKKTVVK